MTSSLLTNLKTLWQLLKRSYFVFLTNAQDQIINTLIWTTLTTAVFHYIMPEAGLAGLGAFMLVTTAGSIGFFGVMENVIIFVGDIQGENALSYELTLPIPHWAVLAKNALANAYQAFIQAIVVIPVGQLLLGIHFPHMSLIKFVFILILISLFSGFFSLFLASILKSVSHVDNLWHCILFPMWFLGGFQYSWKALHSIMPTLSYISLINPLTYILEGVRAATLDPSLSLPYWPCCLAIMGFTIAFGIIGIHVLKKRLDCI